MITWAAFVTAALVVGGISCCGIGAISLFAGGMSDDIPGGKDSTRFGCSIGALGLVCLAIGGAMRLW